MSGNCAGRRSRPSHRRSAAACSTAADAAYDDARKVWNGTVDRRPALIARCLNAGDVQAAVRFAAAHRMLLSVRGGGHHIAGNAVAEGGLMIDLSGMRAVRVDPVTRTARVGPGALLGDFDREAQAHRPGHAARDQLHHRRGRPDPRRRLRLADAHATA